MILSLIFERLNSIWIILRSYKNQLNLSYKSVDGKVLKRPSKITTLLIHLVLNVSSLLVDTWKIRRRFIKYVLQLLQTHDKPEA